MSATASVKKPTIDKKLLRKYRTTCELIPSGTVEAERLMREDYSNSKSIRLTLEQQDIARKKFQAFLEKMVAYREFYENEIGTGAVVSPYYDAFTYTRLALDSYTRSMYACFTCGEIIPVTKLKTENRVAYHECAEGEVDYGNRTSWICIYATFVRNEYYTLAFTLLDKILNHYVK